MRRSLVSLACLLAVYHAAYGQFIVGADKLNNQDVDASIIFRTLDANDWTIVDGLHYNVVIMQLNRNNAAHFNTMLTAATLRGVDVVGAIEDPSLGLGGNCEQQWPVIPRRCAGHRGLYHPEYPGHCNQTSCTGDEIWDDGASTYADDVSSIGNAWYVSASVPHTPGNAVEDVVHRRMPARNRYKDSEFPSCRVIEGT